MLMEPVIDFIHHCDTYKNTHLKIKIGFEFSRILPSLAAFHPRFPHFTCSVNKYPAAFHRDIFMRYMAMAYDSVHQCCVQLALPPAPFCRSLNMDCENQEKDKDGNSTTTGAFNNSNTNNSECRHGEQNKQHVFLFFFFPLGLTPLH